MIIAKQKPTEELLEMLSGYDKIALIGCAGCVTFYGVGGRKETIAMAETLAEAGKKVVSTGISIKQCLLCEEKEVDSLEDADILRKVAKEIDGFLRLEEAEAVVSLACGVGVQNLAHLLDDVHVLPSVRAHACRRYVHVAVVAHWCGAWTGRRVQDHARQGPLVLRVLTDRARRAGAPTHTGESVRQNMGRPS